jgi:hypothetical protein
MRPFHRTTIACFLSGLLLAACVANEPGSLGALDGATSESHGDQRGRQRDR